ncbi:MAG: hypothetical protein WB681_10820 [Candidatus Cybelea sp.]
MKSFVLRRCASLVALVGVLAGCSNGNRISPSAPLTGQDATNSAAKTGAFLYISDTTKSIVNVYSYPQGRLLNTLTAVKDPEGLCADGAGNVWVVETVYSKIVEFARAGTKPIATLSDGNEYPDACAVNRRNGDLAVANNNDGGSDPGSVAIYQGARGVPTIYSDRAVWFVYFLDFDGGGNLFIDGTSWSNHGRRFRLAELPRGADNIVNLKVSGAKIEFPGDVQYNKGNVAIGDGKRPVIYQTTDGTVTGHTSFHDLCKVTAFFIEGAHVIAPNTCGTVGRPGRKDVLIYNYPAGGAPIKRLTGFKVPFGVVVTE